MESRESNQRAAAMAGTLALLAIFVWQSLAVRTLYGGNWSGLFFCASRFGVPAPLRGSTYVHTDSDGYDGQFYRLVAHDPWRSRGFESHIDNPSIR
ncbi:MAG: hypothetical protein ACKV22_33230 [Bryobacteraceae bacterium]